MIGANAVDSPARESLHVVWIVHGPGEDAGTETAYRFDQRLIQRRAFLPQRLRRRVVERLLRVSGRDLRQHAARQSRPFLAQPAHDVKGKTVDGVDRKSTRLNSSHQIISYAVFCLKKKKNIALQSQCL